MPPPFVDSRSLPVAVVGIVDGFLLGNNSGCFGRSYFVSVVIVESSALGGVAIRDYCVFVPF